MLDTLKTQYEESAQNILDKIEAHKLHVEKLVGVIGNLGVTSGYQTVANRDKKALYLWQTLTVISLSALILVAAIIAFTPPESETIFVQGLATRIFLSLAIGIFAAYAARQASNNLQSERRNRKLAIELEALEPFIAPLPPEMQNKLRLELGGRSFGNIDNDQLQSSTGDPVSTYDLVKQISNIALELAKKK